jgi:guanylate cyclase
VSLAARKFIYDLWGEAVNLASRMESHGRTRCIRVTRMPRAWIKHAFDCASLGLIEVRGAGPVEVWPAIGRKRADAPPSRSGHDRSNSFR